MKLLKKLTALFLVCLMALSLTACHKKDEIAVTINGYEFTSAYYMCAFVNAYLQGQQEVMIELSEEEAQEEIDYTKHKIGDKKFEDWVKDTAIDTLKKNAYYMGLCDEKNIKMTDDYKGTNEYYAELYWSSYGYAEIFEPNGVSLNTFKKYMVDEYYAELYFEKTYGAKGENEVPAKDVESKLYKDFMIANVLDYSHASDATDAELAKNIKKFKEYAADIEAGKVTFEEVYNEFNDIKETEKEEAEEDHEGHDHAEPKDALATVIGADGTGYDKDYYNDVKKMKTGEIKVIEKDDKAGCLLVIKQDIKADDFYLEDLDMQIRHLLKDDEFNKKGEEESKKLTPEINKFAVNQFKVKKIVEPNYGY
jgi:hypothetical protein